MQAPVNERICYSDFIWPFYHLAIKEVVFNLVYFANLCPHFFLFFIFFSNCKGRDFKNKTPCF